MHVLEHILIHVATVLYGDFEWDDAKAASNQAKHGVSFEEAVTALVDPNAVFLADDSADEARLVAHRHVDARPRAVRRSRRTRRA